MKPYLIPGSMAWTMLSAFCLFNIFSCSKNSTSQPALNVYATGYSGGGALYWVNGKRVNLTGGINSISTCIAVSGNDVYVAGWDLTGPSRPTYWKNGIPVNLTDGTNSGYEASDQGFYSTCIAVSGNDVYVAGYINYGALYENKMVAKYWKNGSPVSLNDTSISSGNATSVVISGNDVYVLGYIDGAAIYWKNGNPVTLADSSRHAGVSAIAVSGNDVYVAGSISGAATYWKNGTPVLLADSSQHAIVTSIAVSGNDVYVTAYYYGIFGGIGALYWKNGNPITISGSRSAYCIAVSDTDVYIGGAGNSSASIWKNGNPVPLDQGISAYSICLVKQ